MKVNLLRHYHRIVCAANRNPDGRIVLGIRHFDRIMHENGADKDSEQGFIDNHGNFLSREQAFIVAADVGQIIRRVGGDDNKLFSENLY